MKKSMILLLVCWSLALVSMAEAKEKILFIPIDDRPVCLDYTATSLQLAGWDIVVPPAAMLASYNRNGDPEALYRWLTENALLATDAVVSSDSLIYGGLVPSRTHHLSSAVLEQRTQNLLEFKNKFPFLRLYVYTTVMRSPRASSAPVEPSYYAQYGPRIFRLGALQDQKEISGLTKKEAVELQSLIQAIPEAVQKDLYERRGKNIAVTEKLLTGVGQHAFDYFLLGRDDTAPRSDAHREARRLSRLTDTLPAGKIRFFAGADQLGLVLLNRAVNKIEQTIPFVYSFYTKGVGGATIPSYEDDQVRLTVRNHILAAGGFPVPEAQRADLILAVNTPVDGKTLSATDVTNTTKLTPAKAAFVQQVKDYVQAGQKVAVADVAYGNGSDNALVHKLFTDNLAWSLSAYAGWNTAGNTLGYALGQGLLDPYLTPAQQQELLAVRYLDEWVYEANVRGKVRQELIWPKHWVDGALKPDERLAAEQAVTKEMLAFARGYFSEPQLANWQFTLPWSRMFEVSVTRK